MGRNRSLDEFLAGADDHRPAPEDGTDGVAADEEDEPTAPADADPIADPPDAEPMAETFAWSRAGGTCAGCGEQVETRWRDGGALVCPACKSW